MQFDQYHIKRLSTIHASQEIELSYEVKFSYFHLNNDPLIDLNRNSLNHFLFDLIVIKIVTYNIQILLVCSY